jgi:hypothetical protein
MRPALPGAFSCPRALTNFKLTRKLRRRVPDPACARSIVQRAKRSMIDGDKYRVSQERATWC